MKKKIIFALLFTTYLSAFTQNLQWAKGVGGSVNDDRGTSTALDAFGNVYVAGFFSGTVDFDPGIIAYTLSSVGPDNGFILKLDTNGNFVWAKVFGSNITGISISLDSFGNIYAGGTFKGGSDFDPGPAGFTMISYLLSEDAFVLKLDNAGNFLWATHSGGQSVDNGHGLAVDALGNVYMIGSFESVADFDPGLGTFTLSTSGSMSDIFISKLDAGGNFLWAKCLSGNVFKNGYSLSLDGSGNVYSTGYFFGTMDFDPGPGTYTLTSNNGNSLFISKLSASGNFVWAGSMSGTGNSFGFSIALDATGNIYSTGTFDGTIDFDPGTGSNTLSTLNGSSNVFISKLDASGNFIWAKNFDGGGTALATSVRTDASGNVYTTGSFDSPTDFDPGAGNYTLSTNNFDRDVFISKLDANGNFVWVGKMGGNLNEYATSLSVNPSGSTYLTGSFEGLVDFDSGVSNYTVASKGYADIFISKLNSCPSRVGEIKGLSSFCEKGFPLSYSVSPVTGASGYVWSVVPSGTVNTGQNTNSISVSFVPNSTTTIIVQAANACGNASADSLTIIVKNNPTITIVSGGTVLCVGETVKLSATGAVTYTWGTAQHTPSIMVSPTINSMYYVVGTAGNGCKSTATIELRASQCSDLEDNPAVFPDFPEVYPNPASGFCFVKACENSTIKLFNIQGQELKKMVTNETGDCTLDFHDVNAGVYIIEIYCKGKAFRKKIINE